MTNSTSLSHRFSRYVRQIQLIANKRQETDKLILSVCDDIEQGIVTPQTIDNVRQIISDQDEQLTELLSLLPRLVSTAKEFVEARISEFMEEGE